MFKIYSTYILNDVHENFHHIIFSIGTNHLQRLAAGEGSKSRRNIVSLGLMYDIKVEGNSAKVTLTMTTSEAQWEQ